MMKERPILFSAPMVRALLAGTKTQTRRPVKGWQLEWLTPPISFLPEYVAHPENHACPYGQPGGDCLWVREAWRAPLAYDLTPPRDIPPSTPVVYLADGDGSLPHFNAGKYRPPMFMPRWASRITLEITEVRVQRLQDISEDDAKAEGISEFIGGWWCAEEEGPQQAGGTPQEGYRYLWERINGPGTWAANPWVWALSFKRVD